MRRLFILPLLLLLAACAGNDKYPYPLQFLTAEDICPCELGAPPADGSAEQKKEIRKILAIQAKMSDAEKATVMKEDSITVQMIVDPVLGAQYQRDSYPNLFTLLDHAQSDAWRTGDTVQEFWGRQRPWLTDSRVQLLAKRITRPSYPSGHTTTNHVWAHVLAELFPTKREALFKRAHSIGMNRVKGGVHYPSDVEGGKRLAEIFFEKMKANPAFQAELEDARAEIEAAVAPLPKAANDNTPLPQGTVANCNHEPNQMTACR